MKTIGLVLLLVMVLVRVQGQEVMENNPPSVRWFQLTTPHFHVLYPEGFDPQAQRMANTLEHIYKPAASTLGSQPKHFSIILQNRSSFSNAFVTITPRRAEFYTMPTQNYNFAGTVDWLDLTAIHEYRHIVQFEHANQGFNRIMYYLLGNHTLSTLANAAVPDWFWEGDAVTTETALTTSGRGRIPEFGLIFRTNLQEGRIFNYHKQFLRSYKHNIPDHYVLGYHMVSYLSKKTNDPLIWSKVTERAWRSSIVPFTFSNALKKETGMSVTRLYNTMAADLKKEWDASIDATVLTAFNNVNFRRRTNTYTDYLYPQALNDSTVLVTKKGIGDIDQLVILKGPYDEEKVFVQGLVNETGMLSVGGSRVAWNEYRFDPRWRVRNYSVVKVLDLNTREKKTLVSSKTKFAGAALSPDGTKVITVETDLNYHHSLVLIDVEADVIIKKFDNPDNHFYSMPRWSPDGAEIVVLKTTPQGKAVTILDVTTGEEQDILPVSDENIGYPVLYGDYLLYNSPVNGRDNIYAYDRKTKRKYQVTYSRYGSYNPSVSKEGKYLYYNEQTRNGLDVVNTKFDPSLWRLVEENRAHTPQLADYITAQTGHQHVLDSIPAEQFPMKKYARAKGLVNPYSWGLYFNNTLAQAEIGVISKDVLSTTSINGGYQFDLFERTGIWRAGVSYQGFYPILDFNMTYGQREDDTGVLGRDVKLSWTETGVSTGFRIPLLLTRSKYLSELTFSNHVGLTMTSGFESRTTSGDSVLIVGNDRYIRANDSLFFLFTDRTDFGQLIFNNASISFSHSLKQSHRDFNPRFAQFLVAEHYGTPFGGDFRGWLWNVRGHLYFPGLVRHHSLFLRGAYQDSYNGIELDTYTFRNRIFKPRGYSYPRNATFYTLSANYAFPVWYPDIAIGPLVNIQRVRANLFYDYGEGQGRSFFYDFSNERQYFVSNNDVYTSFGGELTFDINLFRLLPQFEVGVRASGIKANRFNNGGWVFELLIGNINF